jgi:hypothetical protein
MAIVPEVDLGEIRQYCAQCVPVDVQDQIRVEATVRGRSVTIFERRPLWREEYGLEWTRTPVAQLRFDPESKSWTLYWADRNGRWHVFDLINPGTITKLLREIETDRTAIFWG